MSIDDIKKRFVDEIKLRAYDDKYIDKIEEREILQIAIQLGVSIDSARPALFQVCKENDFVVESVIIKLIKDQFAAAGWRNHSPIKESPVRARADQIGVSCLRLPDAADDASVDRREAGHIAAFRNAEFGQN